MTTKLRKGMVDSTVVEWTNSGSAVATGAVVQVGLIYGVAMAAIAATTGVGPVAIAGQFELAKANGVVLTQGQEVGWDSTNSRVTTDTSAGVIGICAYAAASGDLKVEIILNHPRAPRNTYSTTYLAVAGDGTNGYATFTPGFVVGTLAAPKARVSVVVLNGSTGAPRTLSSITFPSTTTVRITAASLATNDLIMITVEQISA